MKQQRPGALITAVSALALCVLTLLGWWQSESPVASTPAPTQAAIPTALPRPLPPQPVALKPAQQISARPMPAPRKATPAASPRIETRIITQRHAIAFARHTRPAPYLERGQKRIVQRGVTGVRELRIEIKNSGKRELSRRVLSNRIVRAPRDEITDVGTRAIARRSTAKVIEPRPSRPSISRSRPRLFTKHATAQRTTAKYVAPKRLMPRRTPPRKAAPRRVVPRRRAIAVRAPTYSGDAPLPP
jgi:hypothetical protein